MSTQDHNCLHCISTNLMKLCRTGVLNLIALRLEVVVSDVKVVKSSVLLMWMCFCGVDVGVVDVVIADVEWREV